MAIKNYTTIARVVESTQYTGTQDSFEDLIELAGVYLLDGTIQIEEEEWLVKLQKDEFIVMTDEEFQLTYRQGGSIPEV